ncbi:MAG: glycyl-radical enzyme activating protein [Planctomycetes bacterium]|nr:glycyl-radical enzyme activating protein [Planctomycetota bacterium]
MFNIQRYSLHDGRGIRTNIFLKGCPLRCLWCSNPESQSFSAQKSYNKSSCMDCKGCINSCPQNALNQDGRRDEDKCINCHQCKETCPTAARQVIGKDWCLDDLVDEVLKDQAFYQSSGGGVTLSGGEPLSQPQQAAMLISALKTMGLHLAIETCGYANWQNAEAVLSQVDQILYDIKAMDSTTHKRLTGVPNELILANARKAAQLDKEFIIRIPVIGGHNNSQENIQNTAEFAADIGVKEVHLLPYHRLGESKYENNDMEYNFHAYTPEDDELKDLKSSVEAYGLQVKVGG